MIADTCRWITCTATVRARGVCKRHHARTLRAGRRAATGAPVESVMQAIAAADRHDATERRHLEAVPT